MGEITIRPALATDIPQTVVIELTTFAEHPVIALPWKQYSHKYGVILARQLHFLNSPKKYQYLVATIPSSSKPDEEEVVGYLVGSAPKYVRDGVGEEAEEYKAILPEGTNVKLVEHVLGNTHLSAMKFRSDDMWGMYRSISLLSLIAFYVSALVTILTGTELETLSISLKHQRMGVGKKLMDEWLKMVDADGRALYILSSKKGKGLYVKLGAKQVGVLEFDLRDFGVKEMYASFNLVREGKKV
jgi:ribosomal protein S18 acetylase RimI-like enzyme